MSTSPEKMEQRDPIPEESYKLYERAVAAITLGIGGVALYGGAKITGLAEYISQNPTESTGIAVAVTAYALISRDKSNTHIGR